MNLDEVRYLEKEAETNNGHCSHCHQTIKIYSYGVSRSMISVLRAMAASTTKDTGRAIDVDKLSLKHSERTQLTKMRFHGLVAKVKDKNDVQIARNWLITRKGWQFLAGEPIQSKVLVYNNQVLGHDGDTIVIERVDGEADDFTADNITEPEARVYHDVRTPQRNTTMKAIYLGMSAGLLMKDATYNLTIERLQIGKPVKLLKPVTATYNDIAAFGRSWKAI